MKPLVILLITLSLLPSAYSHSNILYNINLDFDLDLKDLARTAAQQYLKTNEKPIQLDYDNEAIIVKFNKSLDYFASVNPLDGTIVGFRDDSLISKGVQESISGAERRKQADKVFDSLPEMIKKQLRYGEETKTYIGTYIHRYYRYTGDIYVSGDYLEVEVDPSDGDVVGWKRSLFLADEEDMKKEPAISSGVAEQIAIISYDAEPVDHKPLLVIMGEKPIWIVKVKLFYPVFVAVDGLDGHILFFGALRDQMPLRYAYGEDAPITENGFIRKMREERA